MLDGPLVVGAVLEDVLSISGISEPLWKIPVLISIGTDEDDAPDGDDEGEGVVVVVVVVVVVGLTVLPGMRIRWTSFASVGDTGPTVLLKTQNP